MSYINTIMTAMRPKCVYRPADLAESTHIPVKDVSRCLKMLEKGGMVESTNTEEYRRKKLYTTKQKSLF